MSDLVCLCCKQSATEPKLFAGVFCCSSCHTIAQRMMERAQADMRSLQVMMQELIRQALLEGRLQLQPSPQGEVTRGELLTQLLQMPEFRKCSPNSTNATSPSVPPAGGNAT